MFDMQKIGRRISVLRRSRSMTQTELAERLGISFQAVSNWERGNAMPDIAKLPELARMFSVTVDWLIGSPDEIADPPAAPVQSASVLDAADQLPVQSLKAEECLPLPVGEEPAVLPAGEENCPALAVKDAVALPEVVMHCPPPDETASAALPSESASNLPEQAPNAVQAPVETADIIDEIAELRQYLPSETLLEVAVHLLESAKPESMEEAMETFLPNMDEDDVDAFAEKMLEKGMSIHPLLPFMTEDKVGELASKQLAVTGLQGISDLLPFMDEDDVDALAETVLKKGESIQLLLAFMSEEKIGELADRQLAVTGLQGISDLLPFMDEDSVSALAIKWMERGEDVSSLIPFLDEESIARIAEMDCAKNGRRMLKKYAPFMDEDDLASLVRKMFL